MVVRKTCGLLLVGTSMNLNIESGSFGSLYSSLWFCQCRLLVSAVVAAFKFQQILAF